MTTTTTTTDRGSSTHSTTETRAPVFSALIGVSALAVLLQGLWAGIFLQHDGQRDAAESWIDVHARGAEVALAFAVLASVYAFWKRRARRDLWIGGLVFSALIVVESYMGGLIRDDGQDALTVAHVPLAMAIMALSVWLPLRASRSRHQETTSG